MNCKEVEEKIYGYHRQRGNTNNNLVANRINDVSDALGFNSDLLKENCNPSKPFFFQENDIELLKKFMELTQSNEGIRLLCRDYKGAGMMCIIEITDILSTLAQNAGVPREWININILKTMEFTNQYVLRELIHDKTDAFDVDLNELFFNPDDEMDEIDKQIFLEFLFQNTNFPLSDIRGIYWFFVEEKQHNETMALIEEAKKIQKYSHKQLDDLKDYITRRVKLKETLSNDLKYTSLIDEQEALINGKGNLQDNQKYKKNEKTIESIINSHVQNIFELDTIPTNLKNDSIKYDQFYAEEIKKHQFSRDMLRKAISNYNLWKNYRLLTPLTYENETIRELSFRERFKTPMFEIEFNNQ